MQRRVNRGTVVAPLVLAAALSACSIDRLLGVSGNTAFSAGTSNHALTIDALERTYLLHVPKKKLVTSTGTPRAYPLVIMLHGSSATGDAIEHSSQMDALADSIGFIVAYPNASRGAGGLFPTDWNAGACCGAAARENIDDIGFISAMITGISKKELINKTRIYVAGFSDGGRMAYRVACDLATTVAAIAVVSGSLQDESCAPKVNVPVIAFHGTDDPEVPYDDSALTTPTKPLPADAANLPSSVKFWIAQNSCSTLVIRHPGPDVTETDFTPCTGGEVAFYSIQGGVHGWPGEPDGNGSQPPMSELSATQVIWTFFTGKFRR
jgi:polyhydroxybutyrate depolymerase